MSACSLQGSFLKICMITEYPKLNPQFPGDLLVALKDPFPSIWHRELAPSLCKVLEQIFPSRPTWMLGTISPGRGTAVAHSPGCGVMKLEIKGVGATIPDHRHLWEGARSSKLRAQRFHWSSTGKEWQPEHSLRLASWGSHGGSLELPSDCRSTAPPTWPTSVPINCWLISVLFSLLFTHPCPPGRCTYMGPEVARDEIIQAEPSREALHAWVKVGGHRMCQLLLRVYSAGKEEGRESLAGLDCLGPLDSTH